MIKIVNFVISPTVKTCDIVACSLNVMVYTLCCFDGVSSVWIYNVCG